MPTLTSSTSSSSPRCAPFACRRGTRTRGLPAHGQGCGRPVGRAAGIVGGGIAAAFFASLERCACVDVRTKDEDEDAEAAPLMMVGAAGDSAAARSWNGGARGRRRATAGKGKRSGLGCCENTAINN